MITECSGHTLLKSLGACLLAAVFVASPLFGGAANAAPDITRGWQQIPFTYEIQHPYDLTVADRYDFDSTNRVHHFWIFSTDSLDMASGV